MPTRDQHRSAVVEAALVWHRARQTRDRKAKERARGKLERALAAYEKFLANRRGLPRRAAGYRPGVED